MLRIFARCPLEFIQPSITCSGVFCPAAMFSPLYVTRSGYALAAGNAVEKLLPSGRVWLKVPTISRLRTSAVSCSPATTVSAASPCFARSWFTSRTTSLSNPEIFPDDEVGFAVVFAVWRVVDFVMVRRVVVFLVVVLTVALAVVLDALAVVRAVADALCFAVVFWVAFVEPGDCVLLPPDGEEEASGAFVRAVVEEAHGDNGGFFSVFFGGVVLSAGTVVLPLPEVVLPVWVVL